MNEIDKSLDVFGTKPIAKALEKVSGSVIDAVGVFLTAICMPAAEEFGLLLRDRVAAFRIRNLAAITEKAKKRITDQKIAISGEASPGLIREVVEEASWSSDDEIQNMWAGLLAGASGNTAAADDSLLYTDILKRLTPFQARLINAIYWDPRCCSVRPPLKTLDNDVFIPENELIYTVPQLLKLFPGDLSSFVPISNRNHEQILEDPECDGISISRFRPQIEALRVKGLIHDVCFADGRPVRVQFIPCFNGLDFFMRCLGYSSYPVESFLLSLQHGNEKKGIDPFKYGKG